MLKPYPAMKHSGVEWLGEVPAHWKVHRLKYVLRECDVRSANGCEQLLRVSQYTGVTQRLLTGSAEEPDTRADSLIGYKCVEPNNFVVNIMLAWNGSMGVSKFYGIVSPAYCVYRFFNRVSPWYFHHLLRSSTLTSRIRAVSTGVVESRLRLYTDDLYRLEAIVPPLSEQTAIARFLDHADRSIQRYIHAKEKLIALLEEQKQAIIHKAVTGRIDARTGRPYPAYKPSGVEWLGDVPEHWEISRLARFTSLINGYPFDSGNFISSGNSGVPLIRIRDIYSSKTQVYYDGPVVESVYVDTGDIIIGMDGEFNIARWRGDRALLNQRLCCLRTDDSASENFIALALMEPLNYIADQTPSTTVKHLSSHQIKRILLAFPPLPEQTAIARYLDDTILSTSNAIDRANREIDLLGEYRTRLIADVVTGKLDVRSAAAELPESMPDMDEGEIDAVRVEAGFRMADEGIAQEEEGR